jgi:hypothetical protein
MDPNSSSIRCDGCGLPASPEHIAARVQRLELATRFRPIHIQVLFVAFEPLPRLEDDFYGPPASRDFFDSFLGSLNISPDMENNAIGSDGTPAGIANLLEFQRRGYYLAYLSECPVTTGQETGESAAREYISRLAPTLVKRIRFNYKPKHVALLGDKTAALVEVLDHAGMGLVRTGDALFRGAVNIETP